MKCRYCGHNILWLRRKPKGTQKNARYQCPKCHKYQSFEPRHPRTAKILLIDIETMFMEVDGIWDLKTDYIQPDNIRKDWSILCYAAKWLCNPEIMGAVVTPKEAIERNEESIIEGVWKLLDQADICVGQNCINFDFKRLNTKFLKHGLPPPSFYSVVDTLKVAKDKFAFPSNGLDYIGREVLGIGGKPKMVMDDWRRCGRGEKDALAKMLSYCKNDVAPLLEDVYLKFLPWIPNHPNLGIYTDHDKDVCPRCESADISWTVQYCTPQGRFDGFRCNACGALGRGTSKLHRVKRVSIRPT